MPAFHHLTARGKFCMLLGVLLLSGCSSMMSSATVRMTDNLSQAILNNNDLPTVAAGAPAYLLMIDSLINGDPEAESLLRSGAKLYAAYAEVFVRDKGRSQRLTDKALGYALRSLCVRKKDACFLRKSSFQAFEKVISATDAGDVPSLYMIGVSWAGWIQARKEDWNAIAEVSRVETIMRRVAELDEFYEEGSVHLYLGALAVMLPPALGGKPDVAQKHFERAIELSKGKNLMAKVVYARQYARMLFDRELHDRLLREVLEADPDAPGYVLVNTLAQQQAKELLDSADEYF